MNSLRRYLGEVRQRGYERSRSGGWLGYSGGGLKARRLAHNDCLGITKRETAGKDSKEADADPGEAGGSVPDVDIDRSVELSMASSGTWWMTLGPGRGQVPRLAL